MAIRIGVLGIGKIARDQHLPAIAASPDFQLVACASRNAIVEGVDNFPTLEAMLDGRADIEAVVVCTPPQTHFAAGRMALQRGRHVMLEKPPCATVTELGELAILAAREGRTLYQSWHSRHAAAVDAARERLAGRRIRKGHISWREDVRQWHPGQAWIFEAGGFGVFDPGINALSILTCILAEPVFVTAASLFMPANCDAPIAADVGLCTASGARIAAAFDFRHTGEQHWDLEIETDGPVLRLSAGGAALAVDGRPVEPAAQAGEYPQLYRRFAALIAEGACEVDARPFQLVADAFMVGRRFVVDPFHP